MVRALLEAGARIIVPDMRGFGASDKPTEKAAYADSALARDVVALIDHLGLNAVDVIGFSMGSGTTARLLMLRPPQVKSAILAGVGDYALEDGVMEFPQSWPVPDSVPRPITRQVWAKEGARILEQGEIVPGHLASATLTSGSGDWSQSEGFCGRHSWCGRAYLAYGSPPENRRTGSDSQWEGGRGQSEGRQASRNNPNGALGRM